MYCVLTLLEAWDFISYEVSHLRPLRLSHRVDISLVDIRLVGRNLVGRNRCEDAS
jgi:hypothetical protein